MSNRERDYWIEIFRLVSPPRWKAPRDIANIHTNTATARFGDDYDESDMLC